MFTNLICVCREKMALGSSYFTISLEVNLLFSFTLFTSFKFINCYCFIPLSYVTNQILFSIPSNFFNIKKRNLSTKGLYIRIFSNICHKHNVIINIITSIPMNILVTNKYTVRYTKYLEFH